MPSDRFDHFFVAPSDYERSLRFYTETLGWRVTSSWGSIEQGRGATLERGAMRAAIAEEHRDDTHDQSCSGINGTRPTIYVAVDDLDARFDSIADKSCVVISPQRTHWGIRWFVVSDPDGNLIACTQA